MQYQRWETKSKEYTDWVEEDLLFIRTETGKIQWVVKGEIKINVKMPNKWIDRLECLF